MIMSHSYPFRCQALLFSVLYWIEWLTSESASTKQILFSKWKLFDFLHCIELRYRQQSFDVKSFSRYFRIACALENKLWYFTWEIAYFDISITSFQIVVKIFFVQFQCFSVALRKQQEVNFLPITLLVLKIRFQCYWSWSCYFDGYDFADFWLIWLYDEICWKNIIKQQKRNLQNVFEDKLMIRIADLIMISGWVKSGILSNIIY